MPCAVRRAADFRFAGRRRRTPPLRRRRNSVRATTADNLSHQLAGAGTPLELQLIQAGGEPAIETHLIWWPEEKGRKRVLNSGRDTMVKMPVYQKAFTEWRLMTRSDNWVGSCWIISYSSSCGSILLGCLQQAVGDEKVMVPWLPSVHLVHHVQVHFYSWRSSSPHRGTHLGTHGKALMRLQKRLQSRIVNCVCNGSCGS